MRIGTNPAKDNNNVVIENYHRVVIPVYIPHFEGYFAEAFEIFKMCLDSLLLTIHSKTRVTIYNNNSHQEVKNYIDFKYSTHEAIDQVFHSKENLGKINAILAAVKGNLEPLITITDSDVLFKRNWQEEVEKLFLAFPEAGTIAPVPASKTFRLHCNNVWGRYYLSGKMKFTDVKDPEGLVLFDKSLGNNKRLYDDIHLKKYITVKAANGTQACVGCGHFVATLRREVFDHGSKTPAFIKIQGGVETVFIDKPNEDLGFLRLATLGNYAYHMGNTKEQWMDEEFQKLADKSTPNAIFTGNVPPAKTVSKWHYFLGSFFGLIIKNDSLNRLVLRSLGMKEKY